jgi:hypothetical protein
MGERPHISGRFRCIPPIERTTPYGRQEDFEMSPAGWLQRPTYG